MILQYLINFIKVMLTINSSYFKAVSVEYIFLIINYYYSKSLSIDSKIPARGFSKPASSTISSRFSSSSSLA